MWPHDAYAFRYEVLIEQEHDGIFDNILQAFTYEPYLSASLPPGNFRLRIIPYDFRDLPVEGSPWRYFRVVARAADGEDREEKSQLVIEDVPAPVAVPLVPMQMVRVPPISEGNGPFRFRMGSNGDEWNASPSHRVTLTQGFYMSRHEITQAQWRAVMTGNTNNISPNPSYFRGANIPVERVSWFDVLVFANRLSIERGLTPAYSIGGSTNPDDWGDAPTGERHSNFETWNAVEMAAGYTGYRLPTEAQWEFAARAGRTAQWSFGNFANGAFMWFRENSNERTQVVGTRHPNRWGLYDMHGNVWEWVWDRLANYNSLASRTDPTGAVSGFYRVRRGGAWSSGAASPRLANRGETSPVSKWDNLGFRLVRPWSK